MKITTLQWNIGGGRIRKEDDDPQEWASYVHGEESLKEIVRTIREVDADLVTLQETHANSLYVQAKELSALTELPYWVNDEYDDSHLKKGQRLGQAILSRFPIRSHRFELLENPQLEMTAPTGEYWKMHDKGVTTVELDVNGLFLEVKTLHVFPYKKFGSDPLSDEPHVTASRESIVKHLESTAEHLLIQGDFNYDGRSLRPFLPTLLESEMEEVLQKEPTTPKGRHYDHVLYRGLKIDSTHVDSMVLTDHYPIITLVSF